MPFLWEFPPLMHLKGINGAAKHPCSAASALCPVGVARVSRLIGKSDTTDKRHGWQAMFAARVLHDTANGQQIHETPL
jgi:hypothetical protein